MDINKQDKDIFNEWHDDPANWKLGIFYFNKKDKRMLPPKRIKGFGWTVNFANPYSVMLLIVIIALCITIGLLIKK
ncbi:MAG TPA: DUF5808 domain-containing protein [Hanamia sp.]